MQVSIIRDDNMVVVNGEAFAVDCKALPPDVHAVQWYGTHGHVEYVTSRCDHCGTRNKKHNTEFSDMAPYGAIVAAWHAAKVAAAEKAKADAAGPQA